jgi:hypothetical protein
VEVVKRATGEKMDIAIDEVVNTIKSWVDAAL